MSDGKLTVNSAMSLMKTLRERVSSLKALRQQVAVQTKQTWRTGETVDETIPQYDVKKVDQKIMELENVLFQIDSAIKQKNAVTKIDVEINVDSLLKPLE
jgi:hypothetical protein